MKSQRLQITSGLDLKLLATWASKYLNNQTLGVGAELESWSHARRPVQSHVSIAVFLLAALRVKLLCASAMSGKSSRNRAQKPAWHAMKHQVACTACPMSNGTLILTWFPEKYFSLTGTPMPDIQSRFRYGYSQSPFVFQVSHGIALHPLLNAGQSQPKWGCHIRGSIKGGLSQPKFPLDAIALQVPIAAIVSPIAV